MCDLSNLTGNLVSSMPLEELSKEVNNDSTISVVTMLPLPFVKLLVPKSRGSLGLEGEGVSTQILTPAARAARLACFGRLASGVC